MAGVADECVIRVVSVRSDYRSTTARHDCDDE